MYLVTKAELDLCSVALLSIIFFFFERLKMKPLNNIVIKTMEYGAILS